ncbi:MAG: lipoyl synthase [Halobacteriovoraceae bacterium]|nr:lipoyl synthase [Halobacteriovoraceae bacterium]|tara:strand:- start:68929 stop:69888 length:960 start_codon:yes stop_codon:yes gene_type:complete
MTNQPKPTTPLKRPDWLKVRAPVSKGYHEIKNMLGDLKLATVCQEAICPNIEECWSGGTATFMLMGDTCTRACKFCAVKTGNPKGILDHDEPQKVGYAISQMKLDYVVLTSVDRDDLEDLGANHFAETIEVIKRNRPDMIVEVLTPDFNAVPELVERIIEAQPDVFAHNVETVESLTPRVRDRRSQYRKSLKTLELAKEIKSSQYTKTSIMLGVGEKDDEIMQTLKDLRDVGCDVVTFGQYLAPTNRHKKYLPIHDYATPERFNYWKEVADDMGFLYCASGPLVRSSYRAGEFFMKGVIEKNREKEKLLKQSRPTFPSA